MRPQTNHLPQEACAGGAHGQCWHMTQKTHACNRSNMMATQIRHTTPRWCSLLCCAFVHRQLCLHVCSCHIMLDSAACPGLVCGRACEQPTTAVYQGVCAPGSCCSRACHCTCRRRDCGAAAAAVRHDADTAGGHAAARRGQQWRDGRQPHARRSPASIVGADHRQQGAHEARAAAAGQSSAP
jgi:hypothetical protein